MEIDLATGEEGSEMIGIALKAEKKRGKELAKKREELRK